MELLRTFTEQGLSVPLRPLFDEAFPLLTPEEQEEVHFDTFVADSFAFLQGRRIINDAIWDEEAKQLFEARDWGSALECATAIGTVVISAFTLAGAVVVAGAGAMAFKKVGEVAKHLLNRQGMLGILSTLQNFSEADATYKKALLLVRILGETTRAIGLRGTIEAIRKSLTWYDALIIVVIAFAQIAAWILTDGLLLAAQFGVALGAGAQLGLDIANAVRTCGKVGFDANKVKLGQSSQSPPAICQFNQMLYIVWAGTSDKQINVLTSSDAKTFNDSDKKTLSETTELAPVIAEFKTRLYVFWVGRDDARSLNLLTTTDGHEFSTKTTLSYSSNVAPGLTTFNGRLYMAWADKTDDNSIKVASSDDGVHFGDVTALNERTDNSLSLAVARGGLYLGWVDQSGRWRVSFSTDGATFREAFTSGFLNTSFGLSLWGLADQLWYSWADNDANIHYQNNQGGPPVRLGREKSDGTPQIAYPYIAWTDPDDGHPLYVTAI